MQQRQVERIDDGEKRIPAVRGKKAVRWKAPSFDGAGLLDKPTVERMKQLDGVRKQLVSESPNRAGKPRYRARAECILDGYLVRRNISDSQHAAGIMLRDAYQRAALRIQTRNFVMVVVDQKKGDADDGAVSESCARQRYNKAMLALSLEQREVLIDVCGNDQTAGGSKKMRVLVKGLQVLADLWKTDRDHDFLS